jgi:hypothetical protein
MTPNATIALLAFAGLAFAQNPIPSAPIQAIDKQGSAPVVAPMKASRAIDLVICLDVSGSMNGLIDSARQNLWSIVNDMATLQPQPKLRVALLAYGNPQYGAESGFVSIRTPLSSDLDLVSQELFGLKTNGGDEFVGRVVKRALDDLEWSSDPLALKLIFVAGNESATQDPVVNAMTMASAAISKAVLVNTIYCGARGNEEAEAWRQVAKLADGKFAAIEQDKVTAIKTPFDKELSDLSSQLNSTYLAYGGNRQHWAANQVVQDENATNISSAVAATRCLTKGGSLYLNVANDLCDASKTKDFNLADVKVEDLPEVMQKMTMDQRKAHIAAMQKKRTEIQKQIAGIGKKRSAYVSAERKKQNGEDEKAFEEVVLESVRAQAESRGFSRPVAPETANSTSGDSKKESVGSRVPKGGSKK